LRPSAWRLSGWRTVLHVSEWAGLSIALEHLAVHQLDLKQLPAKL